DAAPLATQCLLLARCGPEFLTLPTTPTPKLIPALSVYRILPLVPPRLARARTRAWGLRAVGSVLGCQRYRRAWGFLPAASGPLRRRRGSTPALTRDAREDGGFDGSKRGSPL